MPSLQLVLRPVRVQQPLHADSDSLDPSPGTSQGLPRGRSQILQGPKIGFSVSSPESRRQWTIRPAAIALTTDRTTTSAGREEAIVLRPSGLDSRVPMVSRAERMFELDGAQWGFPPPRH